MVDKAHLAIANALAMELNTITQAVANFDAGGRITSMSITGPTVENMPGFTVDIPTHHIDYPPQMVDGIKQALHQREDAILNELSQLGVTGTEELRR